MEDLKNVISRLSNNLHEYDRIGKPNDARKIGECICKIILLNSDDINTKKLSEKTKYQELIDSLNKKNLDINENHLKKIKMDLRILQDFGNIDSHDNDVSITKGDSARIRTSVENLLRNVFDSKDFIDIDYSLPISIYTYLSNDIIEVEDWKCTDIISIVYPNREITKASNSKDFEFYILSDVNDKSVGYVILGRNVSFSSSFKELFESYSKEIEELISITFLFPKEISKTTGQEVKNRKNSIKHKCSGYEKTFKNVCFAYHFIEDYIWDYCLINILKNKSDVTTDPFFVDQWLYKGEDEILSLDFIDSIVNNGDSNSKPINIIIGDGGVGKTTFCLQAVEKIDVLLSKGFKKKALLLSSFDLPDEIGNSGEQIDSIQSLYKILQDDPDLTLDSKNLALNISSGNLLIIIDGLDEIESKLKERFNLDSFIESVIDLNETYQNCSVLVTSRENKPERFDETKVNILQLKGFNRDLTRKYLESRYVNNEKNYSSKVLGYIEKLSLNSIANVTPLIIRLLCELVESETEELEITSEENYKYFIMSEPLDKVLHQIIMRDILKQDLNISCDQYFEVLKDIVFDYNGVISQSDLDELLECSFYGNNSGDYTSFYVSPLLNRQGGYFKIKHDSFEFWIKARFLINLINSKDVNISDHVLTLISKDCYKGGALVQDVREHRTSDNTSFLSKFIHQAISRAKDHKLEDKIKFRKILSSIAYLSMPDKNLDKEEHTANLLNLYGVTKGQRINSLSIYGDFFPLDFREFSVIDGYFNGYSNLSKSNFPENEVVFVESEFVDIDVTTFGKNGISSDNFQDCILSEQFSELINSNKLTASEQKILIKTDLKKIFKVGFRQNSFVWKSEQLYKQQCTSLKYKLSLSKYLEYLVQRGFLIKESAKGSTGSGYKMNKEYEYGIKDFITQNISNKNIVELVDYINNK